MRAGVRVFVPGAKWRESLLRAAAAAGERPRKPGRKAGREAGLWAFLSRFSLLRKALQEPEATPKQKGGGAMPDAEPGARPKKRGGRVVPSRYMDYKKKTMGKSASDTSLSLLKGGEHVASPKKPSVQCQKRKTSAERTCVLQSTMLDSYGSGRPDLEFSAIKDKTCRRTTISKVGIKGSRETKQTLSPANTEDLIEMLDSQSLLLTYASIKMEKNLARLEGEAERNLLTLSKEAERLHIEAQRKKRLLERLKQESKLSEAVDRQLEALDPIAEQCVHFREQYKHFATALESTRHELPVKEIYTGKDKGQYLADLEKELAATQEALNEAMQEQSASNAKALSMVKELEEASLEVDAQLPRTFADVLDLSADVSKEASLHHQKMGEDLVDPESMKQLYFS
ncbi:HAUS augmin-like complex subunit 8 [Sceloporus undulatus]|uniref:HAUS augmin-like complex subunit 8 n=1 Tax=Sceloporus undulatus TaxID=8520 RepID=UPI001C4D21E2|nr:HAUS augmin-like complex subunit 8 [Sceloporus undulatus]